MGQLRRLRSRYKKGRNSNLFLDCFIVPTPRDNAGCRPLMECPFKRIWIDQPIPGRTTQSL